MLNLIMGGYSVYALPTKRKKTLSYLIIPIKHKKITPILA